MPSSCSYSLGEVRVLRRKYDLIEDNTMDRDSSMRVFVTRSMLTSLNDSTMVSVSKRHKEEVVNTYLTQSIILSTSINTNNIIDHV